MAKKNAIGLKSFLLGPIAGDGGMGTALTEIMGDTVVGSASLTSTALERTEIPIEESDDPIMSLVTGGGVLTFNIATYNLHPDVLVALFGGSKTGVAPNEIWNAPAVIPTIEMSAKAETKNGLVAAAPRVSISAELALNFQKSTPGQINFTGTVLLPTKANTPKITIGTPAA